MKNRKISTNMDSFWNIFLIGVLCLNGIQSRRVVPSELSNNSQPEKFEHFDSLLRDQRMLSTSSNVNDRLVSSIPGLKKYPYRQWSGYIDVDKGRGHLFYWLFGEL
jgi:hypothetical protein